MKKVLIVTSENIVVPDDMMEQVVAIGSLDLKLKAGIVYSRFF